jgi:hypothetical protein
MSSKVPEIFSCLNIEALKNIAGEWANTYKTIKRISLHPYPRTWRTNEELYLLIFEVDDPKNPGKWGFPFIQAQANNAFYGSEFLTVYNVHQDIKIKIPWYFKDQWRIMILGNDEKRPDAISSDLSVPLFPGTYQEQKQSNEKSLFDIIEKELGQVEKLWKLILKKLHASGELVGSASSKKLLEIARASFDENKHAPIKLEYLDRRFFTFSRKRKTKRKEDYEKQLMRQIVRGTSDQSVSENQCCQKIKEIRKPKP